MFPTFLSFFPPLLLTTGDWDYTDYTFEMKTNLPTALHHLVSTSTLVFLTSAAGPPVAAAAALLPYLPDSTAAARNSSRSSGQAVFARKYPLPKRESSISLESASALINHMNGIISFTTPRRRNKINRLFNVLLCCYFLTNQTLIGLNFIIICENVIHHVELCSVYSRFICLFNISFIT